MKKIFPLELKQLMDSDKNEFQLVDIRDEYEYDICCIGGEKINMYSIIDNLDKLSREKKVIIPRSDFVFKKDDQVVFLAKKDSISFVENIFRLSSV